jgi:hypothetical protein
VHHISIQINHQPEATIFQFIILTFVYSSTCFGRFPAHHQELKECSGSLWFYLRIVVIVVLCSWSGRPAGPTFRVPFPLSLVITSGKILSRSSQYRLCAKCRTVCMFLYLFYVASFSVADLNKDCLD